MTSQALEIAPPNNAALAIQNNQKYWTAVQKATLNGIGLSGTDAELQALLHIAQVHQLDPAAGQMTLIPFWTKDRGNCKAAHITINGYLALAERTGRFAELSDPYYCGDDGVWTDLWLSAEPPAHCRVTMTYYDLRGTERRVNGTVAYRDRVSTNKEGAPMAMWKTMPKEMMAWAATRLAIRRGLPEALDTADRAVAMYSEQMATQPTTPKMIMKAVHARRTFNRDDPFAIDELPAGQQPAKFDPSHTWVVEDAPADDDVSEGGRAPRSMVARIKIMQKELGVSDETYHAMILKDYGVQSSKDLMHGQAHEVANRMQAKLFARTNAANATADADNGEVMSVATDTHDVTTDAEFVEIDTGGGAA